MIWVRFAVSLMLCVIGGLLSISTVDSAIDTNDIIVIEGLLNILGVSFCLFGGAYSSLYWLNNIVRLPFPVGNFAKPILIIAFVVSPTYSLTMYQILQNKVENYVECKELRKVSSRFSSRTYANNANLCREAE